MRLLGAETPGETQFKPGNNHYERTNEGLACTLLVLVVCAKVFSNKIMAEASHYWANVVYLLSIVEQEAYDTANYLDRAGDNALSAIRESGSIQDTMSES